MRGLRTTVVLCFLVMSLAAVSQAQSTATSCAPPPTDMQIAYGAFLICAGDPVVYDTAVFRFDGTAGDRILVQYTGSGLCLEPLVVIPTGGTPGDGGPCRFDNRQRLTMSLFQTGSYTILLPYPPSSYTVRLDRMFPAPPTARPLIPGLTISETIGLPGELDHFYFDGFAGDTIGLRIIGLADGSAPCLQAFAPNGGSVLSFCDRSGTTRELQLVEDGRYAVIVSDQDSLRDAAPYDVTLEYAQGFVCDAATTKPRFVLGQTVQALLRIAASRRPGGTPVEAKVWLELPDARIHGLINVGSDGGLGVAPRFDRVVPFDLFVVEPDVVYGVYRLGCRLLDPVTGDVKVETSRSFVIE